MKKIVSIFISAIFTICFFTGCMGLQGPKRTVTLENKTDYTLNITIKAAYFEDDDNPDTRSAVLIPGQKVEYYVVGGFELTDLSSISTNADGYKVCWKPESDDDHWSIKEINKETLTVVNELPVNVTLNNYLYAYNANDNNKYFEAKRYQFPVVKSTTTACYYYKNSLLTYWSIEEESGKTFASDGTPTNTIHYVTSTETGTITVNGAQETVTYNVKYYYTLVTDLTSNKITIKLQATERTLN